MYRRLHSPALACAIALSAVGCEHRTRRVEPPQTPIVPVSRPVERMVTDFADYPGRTEAVQMVDVRPRVTGYLVEMPFREGAEVKAGDILFAIDDRPYKASLDQAVAEVEKQTAALAKTQANYEIALNIQKSSAGAISVQDVNVRKGARDEAAGALKGAQALRETGQLNFDWCKVRAPIDGQAGRYQFTIGNLVNQDQTVLTTLVSLDPIYAYFNMDEPTLERLKRAINEGQIKPDLETADLPVFAGLQNDDAFPHRGTVNFVNNQVNPSTGTIVVRGVFANSKPVNGTRLLAPGMFLRMRLALGAPRRSLLVADRAVGMDQGLRYVYVVDADNRVQYRRVRTGPLQEDGLRVIDDGLKPDDRVVVSMLQQVRPHMTVDVEVVPMPTVGSARAAPETTGPAKR